MPFPNLESLQHSRNLKAAQLTDLLDQAEKGSRPLTPEERETFDRIESDITGLDGQIADLQAHIDRRQQHENWKKKQTEGQGRKTNPDLPANQDATVHSISDFRPDRPLVRNGALTAFKGPQAERNAFRAGMWARATLFNDYRSREWCLTNGLLQPEIYNANSTTSNTQGGFLVPEEMVQAIIDLRELYGVFRKQCRVMPMASDTMLVPRRLGGVTIGPIGENPTSGISQSQPTWNQVRLTAKKAGGLVLLSSEIDQDAVIDLAQWIAEEFAYAFSLFEDQCGFIGTGVQAYMGINGLANILTTASGLAGAVAAASTHDTMAEIDAVDLAKTMAALPEYARLNAKWYCSSVALDLIFGRLMAAAGGNTIQTIEGGYMRSYLGYPIIVSQVLPTSQTTINGVPILFFGDLMKASTMGSRRGVSIFPSEHRYMDTDQIGIRGTERFDICNHDTGTTTVAGPIVSLCGTT